VCRKSFSMGDKEDQAGFVKKTGGFEVGPLTGKSLCNKNTQKKKKKTRGGGKKKT